MDKKKRGQLLFYCLLFFSFFIVAFGQNVWLGWLCYLSALFGYALFWKALEHTQKKSQRFFLSSLWFFAVQLVQLSWMSSITYVGALMLGVYGFFALLLGLQFGVLCLFIPPPAKLKYSRILVVASIWMLFEWSRLFILSGFSWNPVGLNLANNHFSMQLAAIFGVYGLSFWVILVNLFGYKSFGKVKNIVKIRVMWAFFFFLPYLLGFVHESLWKSQMKEKDFLSVLLLQTSLAPEQKEPMPLSLKSFIPPVLQWQRILFFLDEYRDKKIDLIVLPEAALPFGTDTTFYSLSSLLDSFSAVFGTDVKSYLPDFSLPMAQKIFTKERKEWRLSNLFWAQTIANFTGAEVIIGLDDKEKVENISYNAAFHFIPGGKKIGRYEKQVLVPLVEYFPFSWCRRFMARFGITDEFTPGREAKVFEGRLPLGISICYEETIGNIMRNFRKNGAGLFINISNDGWFPYSRLPRQHFEHGKLRSVENGVPLIRACNTGVTGGTDCFGRIINVLTSNSGTMTDFSGALYFKIPLFCYPTLYTLWGDNFMIIISLSLIIVFLYKNKKNLKRFIGKSAKKFKIGSFLETKKIR